MADEVPGAASEEAVLRLTSLPLALPEGAYVCGVGAGRTPQELLVSVQGDGLVLFDASGESRLRSWALRSHWRLACAAVFDAASARGYAALLPAADAAACRLVCVDEESAGPLDEAPALAQLPLVPTALFPASLAAGGAGGVLALLPGGGVQLLPGGEPPPAPPAAAAVAAAAAAAVSVDGARAQCVAVVTLAGGRLALQLTCALAGGLARSGARALAPPAGAAAVAAVSPLSAASAALLFAGGGWAVYALPAGGGAAASLLQRALACFPQPAPAAAAEAGSRKRRGAAAEPVAPAPAAPLLLPLGEYSLCLGSGSAECAFALLDSRHGCVHAAGALAGGGWASGLALGGGAFALAAPRALALLRARAPPPLCAARLVGAAASPAAARALGAPAAAEAAARAPAWRAMPPPPPPPGRAARRCAPEAIWEAARESGGAAAAAERLLSAAEAGAPAGLAAAAQCCAAEGGWPLALQRGCAEGRWGALEALLRARLLARSPPPSGLAERARAEHRCEATRLLLAQASDVGAAALAGALRWALLGAGECEGGEAAAAGLRAEAEAALAAAEAAAEAARAQPLATARLLVAAAEGLPELARGRSALLLAAMACRADGGAVAAAAAALPLPAALAALSAIDRWLRVLRGGRRDAAGAAPPPGLPGLAQAVAWAAALLDAHFVALLQAGPGAGGVARRLAGEVGKQLDSVRALAQLDGAAQHLAARGALPAPAGTVSSRYTVELLRV